MTSAYSPLLPPRAALSTQTLLTAMIPLITDGWSGAALDGLCQVLADALPVDGVAVTVTTEVSPRIVIGASNARARLLENAQLTAGAGPCTAATSSGEQVTMPDIAAAGDRWPDLPITAADGIGSVVATPLRAGGTVIGSMDCYRAAPSAFTGPDLVDIAEAGRLLVLGLSSLTLPDPDDEQAGGPPLQVEVWQATGMVMVARDLSAADALSTLRARSFVAGRLITDLAQDIVSGQLSASDSE